MRAETAAYEIVYHHGEEQKVEHAHCVTNDDRDARCEKRSGRVQQHVVLCKAKLLCKARLAGRVLWLTHS